MFNVGDRVISDYFGEGTVTSITSNRWDRLLYPIEVKFDSENNPQCFSKEGYFNCDEKESEMIMVIQTKSIQGKNNIQLPTAQQAREMVDSITNNKANEEWEHITKLILTAINSNEKCVNGDGTLMTRTIEKLRELGYKVENGNQYNESYYSISW